MTNLEKFREVFGITIDDRFIRPSGHQCRIIDIIDSDKEYACTKYATCHECQLFRFWDKEYVEKNANKELENISSVAAEEIDDTIDFDAPNYDPTWDRLKND